MSDQSPLDRLCALHGIATHYYDIWGNCHVVQNATKQSLLRAMGVAADTADQIETALAEHLQSQWRRPIPAVKVVREGEPVEFELNLPAKPLGITVSWILTEEHGGEQRGELDLADDIVVARGEVEGAAYLRYTVRLPLRPEPGYHRLYLRLEGGTGFELPLIVAPHSCYRAPVLEQARRVWGPAVQLYAIRSGRNWGIGDFADLAALVEITAELGGSLVGLNPLHSLFPHAPLHASPYSPSSRLFWNPLYTNVESVAEYRECAAVRSAVDDADFQARLHALRDTPLVDYRGVAEAKWSVLETLYRHFCEHHLHRDSERARAFRRFQRDGGRALRRHALFEALQAHFHAQDPSMWGWLNWPESYRDPDSDAVASFAQAHGARVEFYEYLQWLATEQLATAGLRSLERGLGLGLYQDLAVSVDRGGAETWANQGLYALNVNIGAPPDDFNLKGQNWGLPPMIPERLREQAYGPFIATLRANMRYAGALRIDHVMGLSRLFWVPAEGEPAEGAYVSYPFDDLLGILALESQRNRCLVIGEDLGTVPDNVREALRPLGVLSYRLLYFEKTSGDEFKPPDQYPEQALVAVTTHDLPTLDGYWSGQDLAAREELELFPSEEVRERQFAARTQDRRKMLEALAREHLLPQTMPCDPAAVPVMTPELVRAVHKYVARSRAKILVVQPEDVFGQTHQVNMPGTTEQYPNWRRKVAIELEQWASDPRMAAIAHDLGATSDRR